MKKNMYIKAGHIVAGMVAALSSTATYAAMSALNNNVRVFEDTLWLAAFSLMIFSGFLLSKVSGGLTKKGYILLGFAGISGAMWKGIGLVKRVLSAENPEWFFSITRESFEGLTGLVLAAAFITIAYSVIQLVKKQKAMMRQRRQQK